KSAPSLGDALSASASDPVPLKVEETGPFPQRDFIPRIGLSKEIAKAAWDLTPEKPMPDTAFETENAWVVIRLKERVEQKAEEWEKEKSMTMLTLAWQKRNNVREAWGEQLRKKAKVDVNPVALSYEDEARGKQRGKGGGGQGGGGGGFDF